MEQDILFCCKWTHPTVCTVYCVQWTVPGGSRLQDVVGELLYVKLVPEKLVVFSIIGFIRYWTRERIRLATSSHRKIIFSMLGWDDQLFPAYEMRDQMYQHQVGVRWSDVSCLWNERSNLSSSCRVRWPTVSCSGNERSNVSSSCRVKWPTVSCSWNERSAVSSSCT